MDKLTLWGLFVCTFVPMVASAGGPPGDLQLNPLGIGTTAPLAARHAGDSSNRLFIADRSGVIVIYDVNTGQQLPQNFLDISGLVDTTFEGGLLGLAFHPDYASNGYFYLNYTRTGSGGNPLTTVIERYRVSAGDPNVADPASGLEILTVDQPAANHNGGDLHFGSDGHLYIGMGDGGASSATSQNMSTLLGKMLRIAPCATASCPNPYTIPADNPFVGTATPDEIWSIGFRNPYRWSFDRETGDMFVADVGEGSREEVSFESEQAAGGLNYGWNCREGDIPGPGGCSGSFVDPIVAYDHSQSRCSITGGYRYRGCIQGLRGTYIFSDFCGGQVYFANEDTPGNWNFSEWTDLSGSVLGFGEDEGGELYLLQFSSISRFESATGCVAASIFDDGFESGMPMRASSN